MITKNKLEYILTHYQEFTKEELYKTMLLLIGTHEKEYEQLEEEYVKRLKWDIVY